LLGIQVSQKQHSFLILATYNFSVFPGTADPEIFHHDGKERNIVQDGTDAPLIVVGFQKMAIFALYPLNILGREPTCDVKATSRDEFDSDGTTLTPVGTEERISKAFDEFGQIKK